MNNKDEIIIFSPPVGILFIYLFTGHGDMCMGSPV